MTRKERVAAAKEAFHAVGVPFEVVKKRTRNETFVEVTAKVNASEMERIWADIHLEFEKRLGTPLFTNSNGMMTAWRGQREAFNTMLTRNDFFDTVFCSLTFAVGEK